MSNEKFLGRLFGKVITRGRDDFLPLLGILSYLPTLGKREQLQNLGIYVAADFKSIMGTNFAL